MRKALALALVLIHLPLAARADAVFDAQKPAPQTYEKVTWKNGADLSIGYWYTEKQVVAISKRIEFLTDAAAKKCVDEKVAHAKENMPAWVWVATGMAAGIVIGWQGTAYWNRTHSQ